MKRICILASLVLVLAACSSDATKGDSATTLAGGVASTSDAPTTIPFESTSAGPPTTIAVPEGGFGEPTPAADGPSAWVPGAEEGDPEVSAEPGVCEPFYEAIAGGPYTVQRCGVWNAQGGQRMWTVTKGGSGLLRAYIWQQSAPNNWVPAMRIAEAAPGVWDDIVIVTGNIDSGENDELVSGIRVAGSGGFLSMNVVDIRSGNPRSMAVYNEAPGGIAVLRPGNGLEIWYAVFADADPECCPSTYARFTLFATSGGDWLGIPGPTVPTGDPSIPVSEF